MKNKKRNETKSTFYNFDNQREILYWLIQENLVEFLVQVSLLYIPLVYDLYTLLYLVYPKYYKLDK